MPTSEDNRGCCQCRILVVDNDPSKRDLQNRLLAAWGYKAVVAEGIGRALLEDAKKKALDSRCCIALVDIRLLDHDNRHDISGLELIADLRPAASIALSGYGNDRETTKMAYDKGAVDVVGKEEGPECLRQVIVAEIQRTCTTGIDIVWHPSYGPTDILHSIHLDSPDIPGDAPYCVLWRLYAQRKDVPIIQVVLRPVTAHYGLGRNITPLERSVVLVARAKGRDGQWHQPEIIKLASSQNVQREIDNYTKYVHVYLPTSRSARIEASADTVVLWDIGAIRYTDIATDEKETLYQWYTTASTQKVREALMDLFRHTLAPWYKTLPPQQIGNVYEYYSGLFPKLASRIANYAGDEHVEIAGLSRRFRNPVIWAKNLASHSQFISRWDAYTHGDLHSNNIFVDHHARTSVIDFERSGPGYILRDFVELEADIRLRLLRLSSDELPLAHDLDVLLLEPKQSPQALHWREIPEADDRARELRKAFDVISALRTLAWEIVQPDSMEEYYWALLMETLFSVTRNYADWKDQEAAQLAKNRATLSAALICERLEEWGSTWLPQDKFLPRKHKPTEAYND